MKRIEYSKEKDEWLKKNRSISFEDVVVSLKTDKLLDRIIHPNQKRYRNQKIYVIEFKRYAYGIPYVEDQEKIFLKTIFASRKYTKKYLKGE